MAQMEDDPPCFNLDIPGFDDFSANQSANYNPKAKSIFWGNPYILARSLRILTYKVWGFPVLRGLSNFGISKGYDAPGRPKLQTIGGGWLLPFCLKMLTDFQFVFSKLMALTENWKPNSIGRERYSTPSRKAWRRLQTRTPFAETFLRMSLSSSRTCCRNLMCSQRK